MEYDEDKAIEFIRQTTGLPPSRYDDDQILNIIDMIWDWQEANGFLEIDPGDDDDEIDITAVTAYVNRLLAKDKGNIVSPEDVAVIVSAELQYEDML